MIKVVFVSDEPSKTNVSFGTASVGVMRLNTAVQWTKQLNPNY